MHQFDALLVCAQVALKPGIPPDVLALLPIRIVLLSWLTSLYLKLLLFRIFWDVLELLLVHWCHRWMLVYVRQSPLVPSHFLKFSIVLESILGVMGHLKWSEIIGFVRCQIWWNERSALSWRHFQRFCFHILVICWHAIMAHIEKCSFIFCLYTRPWLGMITNVQVLWLACFSIPHRFDFLFRH